MIQLAAPPFIADASAFATHGPVHGRNAVRFGVVNAAVGAGRAWVRIPIRATPVAINELIRRNARRAILVGLASAAWADHRRLQAKKRAKSGPRSKWPRERKLEALATYMGLMNGPGRRSDLPYGIFWSSGEPGFLGARRDGMV